MSQKTSIEFIKKHDDFAILYDFDPDGLFSTALMIKLLENLGKDVILKKPSPRPSVKENPSVEKAKKFKNVILLDLAFTKEDLKTFKDSNVLLIDHHETSMKKDEGNITVLKHGNKYTPTSKLVYDLGAEIIGEGFETNDWLGVAGTIADYGGPQHSEWIERILSDYGMTITKPPYFDTELGEVSNIINSARIIGGESRANIAIKSLVNSKTYDEFATGKNQHAVKMYEYHENVTNEIEEGLADFKRKGVKKNNRIFFVLKNNKYNIRSTMSTILSSRLKKTICICEDRDTGYIHGSFRSTDENVLEMIESFKKELEISGGGHKKAAGFNMPKTDLPRFKELFLNY